MNNENLQILVVYTLNTQSNSRNLQDIVALQDNTTAAFNIYNALTLSGYKTFMQPVDGSLQELQEVLSNYSPAETFVFNNCDDFESENLGAVRIVKVIESLGFRHTGPTSDVIALCMNKAETKKKLSEFGVATPKYQVFEKPIRNIFLNFPVIVKPIAEDGSLGINFNSVVNNPSDLFERIDDVIKSYNQPALVEEFISGREINVSIWGNSRLSVLPFSEIDYSWISSPLERLLTYDAKWIDTSPYYQNTATICPAALDPKTERRVKKVAIEAYRAVGIRDFGRADIRLNDNLEPYIIEVNENPNLSPDAGFIKAGNAAGLSNNQIITKILEIALAREKMGKYNKTSKIPKVNSQELNNFGMD